MSNMTKATSESDIATSIHSRRHSLLEKSEVAWGIVFIFLIFSTLGCIAGLGGILRFLFPIGSLITAIYLYIFHPYIFITFNWIIWSFTPLLRRLGDYYRSSFDESGFMLTAPYLVTFVCVGTLFRQLPKMYRSGDLSFLGAISAVFFAFLVGFLNNPRALVIRTFLEWMSPLLFGLYISVHWKSYPVIKKVFSTNFLWIAFLTGIYGIYQFLVAPPWDAFWLRSTEIVTMGLPEPLQIRVWSTMNSPPPYGCVMMAALLIVLCSQNFLKIPAFIVGFLSFLLSMVRAAWLGWVVGLITLVVILKPSLKIRLLIALLLMVIILVPLTRMDPFGEIIGQRIESLFYVQQDSSYLARAQTYDENFESALTRFIGQGLGSTFLVLPNGQLKRIAFDSGILDTFFTLGWIGGLPYFLSMFLLSFKQFQIREISSDPFVSATVAITMSFFMVYSLGPFLIGLSGMVFWGMLGFGMAAQKYYLARRNSIVSLSP